MSLTSCVLALLLGVGSAGAAPFDMTTFAVRQQFTECGFELGNPRSLVSNPVVVLRDPGASNMRGADQRVVIAIVYPTAADATVAHQQAHQRAEARLGKRWPWSDDHGPQLLSGYGDSVWRQNVALVQSSMRTLASMWSVDGQTDEARVARPELFELGFAASGGPYGVDRDFVACLEDATYAAAPLPIDTIDTIDAAESVSEPLFLPGQPW